MLSSRSSAVRPTTSPTRSVSATFSQGQDGYTYHFRCRARDLVGNQEEWRAGPYTSTTVDLTPPSSSVDPLPTYSPPSFLVSWSGEAATSGVDYFRIQYRDGSGPWTTWLGHTTLTSQTFEGQVGHTYYFRSRATDRLGHREPWPGQPDTYVRVGWFRPLHLSIGAYFADENRDGEWSTPISETDEVTLTQVTLRFLDETGRDVVTPTVGSAAEFTTTVCAGHDYRLWAMSADHERRLSFTWPWGGEAYTVTYEALGLPPVWRSYLPFVMRNG